MLQHLLVVTIVVYDTGTGFLLFSLLILCQDSVCTDGGSFITVDEPVLHLKEKKLLLRRADLGNLT